MARALAARLRRAGVGVAVLPRDWAQARGRRGCVAVGARSAAWAPVPDPAVVVVLDEHDEALQGGARRRPGTRATWRSSAARRAGIPVVLVSPCPSLEALAWAPLVDADVANAERQGWPALEVVDRRKAPDPRDGPVLRRARAPAARRRREWCACSTARAGLDCSRVSRAASWPRASGAVRRSRSRAPTSSARGARRCGRRCACAAQDAFRTSGPV